MTQEIMTLRSPPTIQKERFALRDGDVAGFGG
jgi:hypothetical protein